MRGLGMSRLNLTVLRAADFRRYLVGQTLSSFGTSFSGLAVPFAALAVTHSASAVGLLLLAGSVPGILFVMLGGTLGDRLPRRLVMLSSDGGRTVVQGVTAVLLLTGSADLFWLMVLQALASFGSAMFSPSASGLVPHLVEKEEIRQANSLLAATMDTASIGAVAVSGVLIATVGTGVAFAVDAGTFAASTLSLAFVSAGSLPAREVSKKTGLWGDWLEGWAAVRKEGWLATYCLHMAFYNAIAISPLLVLGPVVAARHLGGAPAWAGIGIAYTVGGIGGNALLVRWSPRKPMLVGIAVTAATAPLLVLLAVAAPVVALIPTALLAGAETALYNTLGMVTLQERLPDDVLSRASSFVSVGSLAMAPIGMAAAGFASSSLGSESVLFFAAAWACASALVGCAVPSIRAVSALPPSEPDEAALSGT